MKESTHAKRSETQQDDRAIANVVLITGLSLASENLQIQALEVNYQLATSQQLEADRLFELLRTKRIFTHTAIHTAPKTFLLVVVTSSSEPRLNHHLVGLVNYSRRTWAEIS